MKKATLLFAAFAILNGHSFAQSPINQTLAELLFKQLLMAELTGNYDAFVANGTDELKAALTRTQFDVSSALMKKELSAGYDSGALGCLHKQGCMVYLYCITPKNGGDDILVTMAVKSDKVAGIYFK